MSLWATSFLESPGVKWFSDLGKKSAMNTNTSTSQAISSLQAALQRAMTGRPKVGGFPYLAETLRRAGVSRNLWHLPSCQSLYLTEAGPVVTLGTPLFTDTADVPPFDQAVLVKALRTDQARRKHVPSVPGGCLAGRRRQL